MQVQLKVVNGKQSGHLIPINRPKFMIGRAEDCQLKSKNELISRYHCVILTEEGYVGVRDLGSRNGVFVNGSKIEEETELRNGDKLTIGPLEFEAVISVAMSIGKKPKVESIADVVARTVEQNSLAAAGKGEDDVSNWLLSEDTSEASPVEPTITMSREEDPDDEPEENVLERIIENEGSSNLSSAANTPANSPRREAPAETPALKEVPAASQASPQEKPKPVLHLNLDDDDVKPAAKEEKKSSTGTHKVPHAPKGQAAANLKNFFQNH